ncbi:MAG: DUF47 domain-containing protein [Myxococcales bacterium]|nr:DUF47 domain-containing protein [Myxococcales bacterium]
MAFGRLLPKEPGFFDFFEQHADKCLEGARLLRELLEAGEEGENYARQIKRVEHEGDKITHRTVEALHKTFITPIDREDIHRLITKMDDILDFIDAAAQRLVLYEIKVTTPESIELGDILVHTCELVKEAVTGLRSLKNPTHLFKLCVEINKFENDGDAALRRGMVRLFKDAKDSPVDIIKWKEIYEYLETATDCCEDVANVIEGVVLEYA